MLHDLVAISELSYSKIPIISPGLMFVQKGGYFRRGLLFEGILRFKMSWA